MHAAFVCLIVAGVGQVENISDVVWAMQGTWIISSSERNGRIESDEVGREILIVGTTCKSPSGWVTSTFSIVDPTRNPMYVDFFAPKPRRGPSVGTHKLEGIVAVDERTLKIRCSGRRPQSFDAADGHFLVFVRKTEKQK